MLHDVKVRRKRPTEYVEILPLPPNETRVSHRLNSPSLQEADFFQHRTHKTLSEIRQMGYKVEDELGDDDEGSETIEDFARDAFSSGDKFEDETSDRSRRLVMFKETWMRIDLDGDA